MSYSFNMKTIKDLYAFDFLSGRKIGDRIAYAPDPHTTDTVPGVIIDLDYPDDESLASPAALVRLEDGTKVWAYGEQISNYQQQTKP